MVKFAVLGLAIAEMSCKKVMSPMIAKERPNFSAIPNAVEILPSIPARSSISKSSNS